MQLAPLDSARGSRAAHNALIERCHLRTEALRWRLAAPTPHAVLQAEPEAQKARNKQPAARNALQSTAPSSGNDCHPAVAANCRATPAPPAPLPHCHETAAFIATNEGCTGELRMPASTPRSRAPDHLATLALRLPLTRSSAGRTLTRGSALPKQLRASLPQYCPRDRVLSR